MRLQGSSGERWEALPRLPRLEDHLPLWRAAGTGAPLPVPVLVRLLVMGIGRRCDVTGGFVLEGRTQTPAPPAGGKGEKSPGAGCGRDGQDCIACVLRRTGGQPCRGGRLEGRGRRLRLLGRTAHWLGMAASSAGTVWEGGPLSSRGARSRQAVGRRRRCGWDGRAWKRQGGEATRGLKRTRQRGDPDRPDPKTGEPGGGRRTGDAVTGGRGQGPAIACRSCILRPASALHPLCLPRRPQVPAASAEAAPQRRGPPVATAAQRESGSRVADAGRGRQAARCRRPPLQHCGRILAPTLFSDSSGHGRRDSATLARSAGIAMCRAGCSRRGQRDCRPTRSRFGRKRPTGSAP